MNRTIIHITIDEVEEEGVMRINLEARRNDCFCFYKSFTAEEKSFDVHLFTDKDISEEQAYKSVSVDILPQQR